jgi:hypothetical protein
MDSRLESASLEKPGLTSYPESMETCSFQECFQSSSLPIIAAATIESSKQSLDRLLYTVRGSGRSQLLLAHLQLEEYQGSVALETTFSRSSLTYATLE